MTKNIHFYGSTTIGPKGQVVIPSKLRKELKIKTGDQFIVIKDEHMDSIVIMKAKNLTAMLKGLNQKIREIEKTIKN